MFLSAKRNRPLFVTGLYAVVLAGCAQSAEAQRKPEFAVASVRENKSEAKPSSNVPLDRSESYSPTGGLFIATNQPLLAYILFAYKVNVSETTTPGAFMREFPEWAVRDKFDINARTESPNPTKDDMRLMVQSLLEDRFKLAVHREQRRVPVLALTLAKPGKTGPQLRIHDSASACPSASSAQLRSMQAAAIVGIWPAECGDGEEVRVSAHAVRDGGRDMSMDAIASWLTGAGDYADRPVIDTTGLKGRYDFVVEFAPNYPGSAKPDDASAETSAPTYPEALVDQLGLRLKKEEGSATFFTIDHVEYPSAN
jgi:uncharacterized protein (TIGR03435 family)